MNPKYTLPISEARKKIFEIAEDVQKPDVYYVLTEKGRPKAVLLSYEEYCAMVETLEVSEDMPDLDKEIKELDDDIKTGRYKTYTTLEQLLAKDGFVLAEKAKRAYGVSTKHKTQSGKRTRTAAGK